MTVPHALGGGSRRVVVAGMGSEDRRDDGAGREVAGRVAALAPEACDVGPAVDPLDLLGWWDGAELVVVIDVVRSGDRPGTVSVIDVTPEETPANGGGPAAPPETPTRGVTSTHGIGLSGALRLARAIGSAPRRVVVVGIEGVDFGWGTGLSPTVSAAVPRAVDRVLDLIGEAHSCA
jgi:hydrogenase maturation protease